MKIRNLLNAAILRIFIGVLMLLGSVGMSGQNCYVHLSDISGIEHSNYQSEIEEAACELRDSLPANFQNDFKVYDAGFYSHIESYRNYNYLDAFNDIKNDITTTYYLYVGKQNDSKGVYTKFFVDINLADVISNGCIPDFNEKASKLIEYVITENYNRAGKTPSSYPTALIKGIKALNNYISNVKSCCQLGGDVAQCLECNNPNNIAAKLMTEGFNPVQIKNIGNWDTGSQDIPEVTDYANQLFTVGDGLTGINIPQSYLNVIPEYEERGLSIKIYITKDENICDGIWQSVRDEIENSDEDVIFGIIFIREI